MIIGVILLVVGFIFIISGFLGFGNQFSSGIELGQEGINPKGIFSSFGGFALGGFMLVPGLFLTSVGFILRVLIGNRREITAYAAQQVIPVAEEGIEKITPTVEKAAGNISKEIAKGIKEGINEADNKE